MNKKEELLIESVHKNYQCVGKYPCGERAYCRFCEGVNDANDCSDECFAEEFAEGFEAGWDAALALAKDLIKNSTSLPPEYSEMVDKHFDEMIF